MKRPHLASSIAPPLPRQPLPHCPRTHYLCLSAAPPRGAVRKRGVDAPTVCRSVAGLRACTGCLLPIWHPWRANSSTGAQRSSGIASDAQALTSTDMYCPHALVTAAEKHSNVFPCNSHAVANHTSRFADDVQRENGFVYNLHAFAATDHDSGFAYTVHPFAATNAHPIGTADTQQDSGFAYNLHAFTNVHTIAADVSCPHPIAGRTNGFAPMRTAHTRVCGRSGKGAAAAAERGDDNEGRITRGLSLPIHIMCIPSPRRARPGGWRCGSNSSCNVGRGREGPDYPRDLVIGEDEAMSDAMHDDCSDFIMWSKDQYTSVDVNTNLDDTEMLHEYATADMQDDVFDGGGFKAEFACVFEAE
ncbi:hypothetical protein DFH09DRAFT_1325099 [Mycena vulgaris]|nr:hypothetical protein DFH09DRAFT_1325099 [Mycena vulgaris]